MNDEVLGAPSAPPGPRTTAVVLLAIAALALWVRTLGLSFGLPAIYNPDEIAIMSRALAFGTGDLNPHNFVYPSLYFYILFAWIGGWFVAGWLSGRFESLAAFERLFFTDPTVVYVAGRALSVACGVATVYVVYRLGRRLFGSSCGLAAALFLSVAPFHVRDSHYVKHDVPVTLAITVSLLACTRLWVDRRAPARATAAASAGALCGVAFSMHYYAVFVVLPLACAILFGGTPPAVTVRRLAAAGLSFGAAFLLLSPFILVEPFTAWRDIVANRQIVVDRAVFDDAGFLSRAAAYASLLWHDSAGWPVVLLAAVGAGTTLLVQPRHAIFLGSFLVPLLGFISNTVVATRYLTPVLPALCVLAGVPIGRLADWPPSMRKAAISVAVAAAIPGLLASIAFGLFVRNADTRTLAQQFIERTVPDGATVLVQPYSVQLRPSREALREALSRHGQTGRASNKTQRQLALSPYPTPAYRTLFIGDGGLDRDKIYVGYEQLSRAGLSDVRQLGVEYVVINREPDPGPQSRAFLEALAKTGRRLAVFSPDARRSGTLAGKPFIHNTNARLRRDLERPGPVVEVWHLSLAR